MIPLAVYERAIRSLLGPVRPFFEDDEVNEILINGPAEVYVERRGRLELTAACFSSAEALHAALRTVAQYVGRPLGAQHPILEARLPDGSRVQAVLPPAAPAGPIVAIRRFQEQTLTIERLIELGSSSPEAAEILRQLVLTKRNLLVSGGTGTGKTCLLNCLSSFIAADERVVVIEDAQELRLQQPHRVQLEARPPDEGGRGAVTIRELFRASLRLRPDRIVIGELRGGEALELVQAMTSGHGGCLSTLHASHPLDALRRLETLASMSDVELPLHALRAQIVSAIHVIVQVARRPDGARVVSQIAEVEPLAPDGSYQVRDLYRRAE